MNTKINLVAFYTILRKEILRVLRIWVQTIVPPAITMTLYFVIFGNLIGSRIGNMEGYTYMQFIAPGIIMMSVITNSYGNVVSSFFGAKYGGYLDEMLVAPVANATIILGHIAGGILRGLLVGSMVTIIVFLSSMVFALAGFINALFAKKFDDIAIIPTFIITPLTYLGGVFYSINLLPEFWQNISLFNPILYMVNAFRYGVLGSSDIDITYAYMVVGIFIIILFSISLLLLKKGTGIRE